MTNEITFILEGMLIMNFMWLGAILGIYQDILVKRELNNLRRENE